VAETLSGNAMVLAAGNGHLAAVEWLHCNKLEGCYMDGRAMDLAALGGHLPVVEWLHANRQEGCSCAMEFAVRRGHLPIVEWLHRNQYGKKQEYSSAATYSDVSLTQAAKFGHLSVLEWLAENDHEVFQDKIESADREHFSIGKIFDSAHDLTRNSCNLAVVEWVFAKTLSFMRMQTTKAQPSERWEK